MCCARRRRAQHITTPSPRYKDVCFKQARKRDEAASSCPDQSSRSLHFLPTTALASTIRPLMRKLKPCSAAVIRFGDPPCPSPHRPLTSPFSPPIPTVPRHAS